ncbi:hypothetical protein CK203_042767 [Vitis vinifera]|uniref:Retrotransposon gag domain-containing protein n=1 Tax=Vitis vinifera TaxID=29760 RepID=A0A438HQN7_VITVI|nr:hypothetical protein CK203_042767 [Vitis vinifera]
MSWLYASLSEDIMAQIVGYSTAMEIWNALNQIYFASSMARFTELRTKLQTLKKDGLSAGEYIQRLKSICNSIAAIGEPVSEKGHLIYLFNGLDSRIGEFLREEKHKGIGEESNCNQGCPAPEFVRLSSLGLSSCEVQWILVYGVKPSPKRNSVSNSSKNGTAEYLIEGKEGTNDHSVIHKCAEI